MNIGIADKEQQIALPPYKGVSIEKQPQYALERNKKVPMDKDRSNYYKAGFIALMLLRAYNEQLDPKAIFIHPMDKTAAH